MFTPNEIEFTCLRCGHCCNRIVILQDGVRMGLCLLPGEKKLFKRFPKTVLPYIALRKPGHSRRQVVAHQMIKSPCPLYDATAQTCTAYAKRPIACKAYPFSSYFFKAGYSLEANCAWAKTEQASIKFGETPIRAGKEQDAAATAMGEFFVSLNRRMRRTGYTQLAVFDSETRKWFDIGEVPCANP